MRGSEPGSARRDQRPWEPMRVLRGAGARRSHSCHSRGRAGQAGASVAQAPPRRALRVGSGRRAGAAPAFAVENDRARLRLPGSSPAAGAGSGRAETRGGDRASWQAAPTSDLPGEQTRRGCLFASPASPALLPGVPLTPGHPEAARARFQTTAWEIEGPRRASHRSRLAQLTCHLATRLDLRVRTELPTGGASDPETPVNTAAPSHWPLRTRSLIFW